MYNSVFGRLNFVDAIIISTGAKLILRPILSNISTKLRQYDFNRLLKLKPDPIRLDLPDDITVKILSKVDIVTLRRCTLVLSLDSILPQIVSFSTPLHASLFIRDKSECWYGRLINKLVSKSMPLLLCIVGCNSVLPETVINVTKDVFLWVNMPVLKPEAVDFFKKLTGLRSLEIQLPALPFYDSCVSSHLWFKWDARFGVYDNNVAGYGYGYGYAVYVFGDKVDDSETDDVRKASQMAKAMNTVWHHTILHYSVVSLGYERGDWKTGLSITTKDAEGNGGMVTGPESIRDGGEFRFKVLYLPSTLKFNRYVNEGVDPVQVVQDVMVLFSAYVDASVDQYDFDVIMGCLGDMDDGGDEADQKTELRQIVADIIADENCVVL